MGQHNIIMTEGNNLLKEALDKMGHTDTNKDEATVFTESWIISYRKLSLSQQLCAKKAIDDY